MKLETFVYRCPTAGMSSFLNRGSISSLIASLYTVAAITVADAFASASMIRSYVSRFV